MSREHPKVVDLTKKVFARLLAESNAETGLWEGKMTDLIAESGDIAYYTRILRLMVFAGAVTQIRRGSAAGPSIYRVLNAKPDFMQAHNESKGSRGLGPREQEIELRVAALERMVGGLDVPQAVSDIMLELRSLRQLIVSLGEDEHATGSEPTVVSR